MLLALLADNVEYAPFRALSSRAVAYKSMSKRPFDQKIEALDALRASPPADTTAFVVAISKALADRNNFVVSKAAALAGDFHHAALIPNLLSAFDRFMQDPVKTDPQCWAKNAIAKALKDLGHTDAAVYLRGARHIQMEPAWGPPADSATTLRGTCLLALLDCHIDDLTMLTCLAEALADPEKPVRIDAARALSGAGIPEAAPLLRLKALVGDEEPEVIGQCLVSLLALQPDVVPFVTRYFDSPDPELQIEAVATLAQSHASGALPALKTFWNRRLLPEVRQATHAILAASRYRDEFPPVSTSTSRSQHR